MKIVMTAFITLACVTALLAQQVDEITTSKGTLQIRPIKHASMVFSWNKKTIYLDPTDPGLYKGIPAPNMILITDIHQDHMDLKSLMEFGTKGATIVAPQAVVELLPPPLKAKVITVNNGNEITLLDMTISAIPMYNLPESPEAFHTKGRGNGYVLTMGGKRVYISGDTEDIPEMRELKNIDIAFVCMNLPYTMDVKQAASAVLEFRPVIVYPYHYRGQDTEVFRNMVTSENKKIEVRLRNWYR